MKKLFLLAIATIVALPLSAQIYVGGTIGLNSNSTTDNLTNPATTAKQSNIQIAPNAGYYLNDQFSVGARLLIGLTNNTGTNAKTTSIGINPYARYELLSVGDFSILAEGGLSYESASTKTTFTNIGYTKQTDGTFRLYAEPVLTYKLTDNIVLETALNVAALSFETISSKSINHTDNPASDTTTLDDSTTNFRLGVNSTSPLGLAGLINIGFTYRF